MLGLLVAIIALARLPGQTRSVNEQMALADEARKRKLKKQKKLLEAEQDKSFPRLHGSKKDPVIERELSRVPTPWGWPQHADLINTNTNKFDISESMSRFTEKMIHEKKTVDDKDYLDKRNASLRALLEDRYGRSARMTEVQYEKVKAPRLRDPGAPHDQMDNFPSGKANQLAAKLRKQSRSHSGKVSPVGKEARGADLKNIKTPWGW